MAAKKGKSFKHAPQTAWRELSGEAIVLDLETSVYFSLNDTAAFVWARIGAGDDVDAIVEQVCGLYDVAETDAKADVEALISELSAENLLTAA